MGPHRGKNLKQQMAIVLDDLAKLIGCFLQIAGLFATVVALFAYPIYWHLEVDKYSIYVLVSIPVCGITLSFLWSSMVQLAIFRSDKQQSADQTQEREGHPTYPGSYKGGMNHCLSAGETLALTMY